MSRSALVQIRPKPGKFRWLKNDDELKRHNWTSENLWPYNKNGKYYERFSRIHHWSPEIQDWVFAMDDKNLPILTNNRFFYKVIDAVKYEKNIFYLLSNDEWVPEQYLYPCMFYSFLQRFVLYFGCRDSIDRFSCTDC